MGAEIARLMVTAPDFKTVDAPLVASADIARMGGFGRLGARLAGHDVSGWSGARGVSRQTGVVRPEPRHAPCSRAGRLRRPG